MANTFTALTYHVIFSTKNRERWIDHGIESRIWSYMAGITVEKEMTPLRIGGMPDHVHLLVSIPAKLAVSKAVQLIKGASSKWIHDAFPKLGGFNWQDGFGVFTLGKSQIGKVDDYIQRQREHHRVKSFQEEFLTFLKRHEIAYDPRYVWG